MSNRHRNDQDKQISSVDRIRRRMDKIEAERRNARPKINPFTLLSIGIILVLVILMSNVIGN